MLGHGIPQTEFFVPPLASQPWSSSWLASAPIIALAWNALGPAGLVLLKTVFYGSGFLLAAVAARRRGAGAASACVIAALAACAVSGRFVERPGMFSVCLLGAGMLLCETEAWRRCRGGVVALLLLVPVLWSLLHAEWYVGIAAMGLRSLAEPETRTRRTSLLLAGALLPFPMFALVHPSGVHPLLAPLNLLAGHGANFQINEYTIPIWRAMPGALAMLVAALVAAGWLAKNGKPWEAVLIAGLSLLSLKVSRAALPAMIVSIPFIAEMISLRMESIIGRSLPRVSLLSVALVVCGLLKVAVSPGIRHGTGMDPTLDSRGIAAVLGRIGEHEGPLLAEFGRASALLANPEVVRHGVVMDGRQEAYSLDYYQDVYLGCFSVNGDWQKALTEAHVAFYFEPYGGGRAPVLWNRFLEAGWEPIAWDDSGRLVARPGVAKRWGFAVLEADPADVGGLETLPPERRERIAKEFDERIKELQRLGASTMRGDIARARIAVIDGDWDTAGRLLGQAYSQGASRFSSYWRVERERAMGTGDFSAAARADEALKRLGVSP